MNVVLQFAINLVILALAIKSVSDAIRRKSKPDVLKEFAFALSIGDRSACTCVCDPMGGSCAFLYFVMIPRRQRDDEAILVQQRQVYEGLSIHFRDVCDRLRSMEDTKESRLENSLRTIEVCEQAFREDVILLNYEARLRISLAARNPKDTANWDLAIERTWRSIDFYPNETALEMQGLGL